MNRFHRAAESCVLCEIRGQCQRRGRNGFNGELNEAILSHSDGIGISRLGVLDGDDPFGVLKPIRPRTAQLFHDELLEGLMSEREHMPKKREYLPGLLSERG